MGERSVRFVVSTVEKSNNNNSAIFYFFYFFFFFKIKTYYINFPSDSTLCVENAGENSLRN